LQLFRGVKRILTQLVAGAALMFAASGNALAEPPPTPAWLVAPRDPVPPRPLSYFEQHSLRVERDLLMFQRGYTLERMRDRDTLELYGPTPGSATSTAAGIGIFSAIVVSSAHTPAPLRFAFDRSLHLGPAIFDGGGMGAGFGGSL
jgi:hypothetical protein